MTPSASTLERARERLDAALLAAIDAKLVVPCRTGDGDLWTSDDREEREAASWRCRPCPLLNECGQYAAALSPHQVWGVWGGIDRTPRRKEATC